VARRTGPVLAPEGEIEPRVVESITGPAPLDSPLTLNLDTSALDDTDDNEETKDDNENDDALSLTSLPEDIDPEQFPIPDNDDYDPIPELSALDDEQSDDES